MIFLITWWFSSFHSFTLIQRTFTPHKNNSIKSLPHTSIVHRFLWSTFSVNTSLRPVFIPFLLALLFFSLRVFYTSFNWLVFTKLWVISVLKIARTLLSIIADFNNIVACMISILPLISISPVSFSWILETVPKALTTSGITVTFMCLFCSLARSK